MKTSSCTLALTTGSIALLLAACASSPVTPQPALQAGTEPDPVKTCQTDYATGSHYQQHTICESEADQRDAEQITQDTMAAYRALNAVNKKQWEPLGH